MSPGARDGGLSIFPSQGSVPSPRSGGPSRPLASSQGLCLLQALGGMGEERTPGPIPLDSCRLVIPLVPTCEHRLWSLLRDFELGAPLSSLLIGHMGPPRPHRELGVESTLLASISELSLLFLFSGQVLHGISVAGWGWLGFSASTWRGFASH